MFLLGVRQSKFRHLHGKCLHRSLHIENIRNLCKTVPGESNMFCANRQRCAIPIEGAGGLISVLEVRGHASSLLTVYSTMRLLEWETICSVLYTFIMSSYISVGDRHLHVHHTYTPQTHMHTYTHTHSCTH